MLIWLRHQYAVYSYGLGLLMLLAIFLASCAIMGALVVFPPALVFGYEPGALEWLIGSLICAPIGLPTWAKIVAAQVKENPPPSSLDLLRAQSGLPPRNQH